MKVNSFTSSFKRFALNCAVLLLVVLLISLLLKIVVTHNSKLLSSVVPASITEYQKINPDVLILGSSVMMRGIIPGIISNKMDTTVYNGSVGGGRTSYSFSFWGVVKKNHQPKIVLIDYPLSFVSLGETRNKDFNLLNLRFFIDNPIISMIIKETYPKEYYLSKYLFAYTLNSNFSRRILTFFNGNRDSKSNDRSEIPKEFKSNNSDFPDGCEIESTFVNHFKSFTELVRESGGEIVLVSLPILNDYDNYQDSELDNFILQNKIPLIDLSKDKDLAFWKANYFNDYSHLNKLGAKIVSNELADSLMQLGLTHDTTKLCIYNLKLKVDM